MSSLATNAQSNMKQIMRTALVGVSPADQLMLKGYLRVLLRLEADLEWVPANHPEVNLLFINEEFRYSSSVKKLLSQAALKPVLFVKRDPEGQAGGLEKDLLVLPLTQLAPFSDWLMTNISVLQDNSSRQRRPDSEGNKRQNTPKLASDADTVASNTSQTMTKPDLQPIQQSPANTKPTFDNLIGFIKTISAKPAGMFELIIDGKRVGLASLKRQRLWLDQDVAAFNDAWQVQKVTVNEPTGASVDLFQWLWIKAWQTPQPLLPLVSDEQLFHLRYWPKPENDVNRSDLLRIFTALEGEPRNVSTIASLADTSVNAVKKAVAGLLLSGALQPEVYQTLKSPVTTATSGSLQARAGGINNNDDKTALNVAKKTSSGSALDDMLARRAAGETMTQSLSSSIDISTINSGSTNNGNSASTSTPAAEAKPKPTANTSKRGFLSKLRSKLGL